MRIKMLPCGVALLTLSLVAAWSGPTHAQQAAPKTPSAAVTTPAAPTIADADRQAVTSLQIQVAGLSYAQQVLQKELDSASVELQRTIAKMRTTCGTDYELSPQLACVPKTAEPKKKGAGSKPGGGV